MQFLCKMLYNLTKYGIIEVYKNMKGSANMKRYRFVKHNNKIAKVVGAVFLVLILLNAVLISKVTAIKEPEQHYTYMLEPTTSEKTTQVETFLQTETFSQTESEQTEIETIEIQMENAKEIEIYSAFFKEISEIPVKSIELYKNEIEKKNKSSEEKYILDEEELFLLNQLVFAETEEDPPIVQKGVTWVVLNRMNKENKEHPNSLEEVIFEKAQFSTAKEGKIYFWYRPNCSKVVEQEDITDEVKESVMMALDGDNPIGDKVGYYDLRYISSEQLALREEVGFYSSDWVLDENGNLKYSVDEDVIVYNWAVFHNEWP